MAVLTSPPTEPQRERDTRSIARTSARSWVLRVLLVVLGVAALVALVIDAGAGAVVDAMRAVLPYLPIVIALELLRSAAELCATRMLARRVSGGGTSLPWGPFARAQMVAAVLQSTLPAGRLAGEGAKAAMLAPVVGAARAAAIATWCQTASFVAHGIAAIATAVAVSQTSAPVVLVIALTGFGVSSVALAFGIDRAARSARLGAWIARRWTRAATAITQYQRAVETIPGLPIGPSLALFVSETTRVATVGMLAFAAGAAASWNTIVVAHGAHMLGAIVGDLVPAQVGVTDALLRWNADALGVSAARAVSVALGAHVVSLGIAAFFAVIGAMWRARGSR